MDMKTTQIMLIHPLVWNREEERDVRALFVRDLVVPARIGVHHQEQARTQKLRLEPVRVPAPALRLARPPGERPRLRPPAAGHPRPPRAGHINLLETLGERIVQMCFAYPQVQGVHLQIAKLEAHRGLHGRVRGLAPAVGSLTAYRLNRRVTR